MNHRVVELRSLRLTYPLLFIILLLSLNLGVLSVSGAVGVRPPMEEFKDFTVGISAYEPGTAEFELSALIETELWESFFNTDLISINSSNPFEVLAENPVLDFFIIIDVVAEENQPYAASIYSRHISDPQPYDSASQRTLSSMVSEYISDQARSIINSRTEASTTVSNEGEQAVLASDPVDLLLLAQKQFADEDYAATIKTLNELLLVDEQGNWRIHYFLYRSHKELGNVEKQLEHIKAGLDIDPENEYLLISEANYYFREKDYEKAIPIYHTLLDSAKNGPVARYNLSLSYERLGDFDQAIETLIENPNESGGTLAVKMQNQLFDLQRQQQDQLFDLQRQQRTDQIRIILGALALLIILIILIYMVIKRQRRKLQIQTWTNGGDPAELAMKNNLLQTLNSGMNAGELRELCFELGLDWDNLSGDTKKTKVISLIEYYSNRNDLLKLQEAVGRYRPDLKLSFGIAQ